MGDFNYPRLADFGAAISGANKLECQQVLEELDVRDATHLVKFCLASFDIYPSILEDIYCISSFGGSED